MSAGPSIASLLSGTTGAATPATFATIAATPAITAVYSHSPVTACATLTANRPKPGVTAFCSFATCTTATTMRSGIGSGTTCFSLTCRAVQRIPCFSGITAITAVAITISAGTASATSHCRPK
jgi:hypothetical protein